jgi:DNA-binding CsgD family transcriptional regulator
LESLSEFARNTQRDMNELKVNLQQAIVSLREQGWSKRRIARELGLDRGTVGKYLRAGDSKPAIRLTGSGASAKPKPAISLTGSEGVFESKPAHAGRVPWSMLCVLR